VRFLRINRQDFEAFVSTDGEEGTKVNETRLFLFSLSSPSSRQGL